MFYSADFETVVLGEDIVQTSTEVWAWAITRLYDNTDDVTIGNSIETFFDYLLTLEKHPVIFFHNLRFDGSFIMSYLYGLNYELAFDKDSKSFKKSKDLDNRQLTFSISDMGQWYSITVKYKGHLLEFRDSLKLLNSSVAQLGKDFGTKHRKLSIDYVGHLHANEVITDEEKAYISNDVLVVKEALEKFLTEMKLDKKPPLTIGSACLKEFKKLYDKEEWSFYFPDLSEVELDKELYGYDNADSYIRASYFGGWCYCRPDFSFKVQGKTPGKPNNCIKVFDVNSLYPSVLRDHNNRYPYGLPHFFKGYIPNEVKDKKHYSFLRFKCNFKLKDGALPFIQIKNNPLFRRNDNLFSSYYDKDGEYMEDNTIEFVMSETTYNMFRACYDVFDFEFLDGCWFECAKGLFDYYIDKFFNYKLEGAKTGNKTKKATGKLFLNSLYGKFGTSVDNVFKLSHLNSDGILEFDDFVGENKKPVYIPVASAVTSYARRFTVTGAIYNKEYFAYSDTDSIHLVCPVDYEPKGITIHDSNLSCWKLESQFENGIYIRQKTYMEYDKGVCYDIKACGLSRRSKDLFECNLINSCKNVSNELKTAKYEALGKLTKREKFFLSKRRTEKDFKQGLTIPSNLEPQQIQGGVILVDRDFTIK